MEDKEIKSLRRYTNVMSALDILMNKHIVLTSTAGWADVNDNLSIERYRRSTGCGRVLAICMTAAFETYHHWHIFAGGQNGLHIEFDRAKFSQRVENDPSLLAGSVEYYSLPDIRNLQSVETYKIPFMKRSGFSDEKEYRVLSKTSDPECRAIPVPISLDMITKIVFSPFVPDALVQSTKKIMRSIEGCAELRIGQSQLTTNRQWISNIDRLLKT